MERRTETQLRFLKGNMLKTLEVQTDMGTKRQDIRTLSKRHPKLETLMNRVDKTNY